MAKDKKEEEPKSEFESALGVVLKTDVKELDKYLNGQKGQRSTKQPKPKA